MKISRQIIKLADVMYRVHLYTSPDELEEGNAYTFASTGPGGIRIRFAYVLPYIGPLSKHEPSQPGIYTREGQPPLVIYPKTDAERKLYSVNRIFEITPETINSELTEYLKDVNLTDLKYTGNVFTPRISEHDDVGMKAVKLALIKKQFDFDSYKGRFTKPHDKANSKKALDTGKTLTFRKLDEYADVFDLEYGIILFDKEGARDPLSPSGKAMVVFNDVAYPIEDKNIEVITNIEDISDREETMDEEVME